MRSLLLCRAGSSRNSLDASSTEAVNGELTSPTTPVIELTQHLTTKRPLRSEAIRERRSSATSRGATVNGAGSVEGLVCSSPSQNSISSNQSSGSNDDLPPPLPAKQMSSVHSNDGPPPEKPPHPAHLGEPGPPPPPPKKPARPLPPL